MFAEPSPKSAELLQRLRAFFDQHIYPNEERYHREMDDFRRQGSPWQVMPLIEELKPKARAAGLWNMFLPHPYEGHGGISNLDYAPLCEVMGRVSWSGEVFNCSAPDTGNMETLERYATPAQKNQWLKPLLAGEIRSAFLMTEPAVASSDATNIQCSIRRDGDHYVINGRKWFSSGAGSPRCKIFIVMGKTDADAPRHAQQSMVLVPRDTPGVTVARHLSVFGYDDAPHGHMEVQLDNVRVPVSNLLGEEGGAFKMAMSKLAEERLSIAVSAIANAERAVQLAVDYTQERKAFGQAISDFQNTRFKIAELHAEVLAKRVFVDRCIALHMEKKLSATDAAAAKMLCTELQCKAVDECLQFFGGYGYMLEYPIARMFIDSRIRKIAGGASEIMRDIIARELFAKK